MASQASAKLLHIQPPQFEALLAVLAAKTPPKTQTVFSVKQIVARLQGFITQSLENHYSFDEIALIIQSSLVEEKIVEIEPDLKGSTLKQYYLEVQRDKPLRAARKRRSGIPKNASTGKPKTTEPVVERGPIDNPALAVRKTPMTSGRSQTIGNPALTSKVETELSY
jgi:hypothetical protein